MPRKKQIKKATKPAKTCPNTGRPCKLGCKGKCKKSAY